MFYKITTAEIKSALISFVIFFALFFFTFFQNAHGQVPAISVSDFKVDQEVYEVGQEITGSFTLTNIGVIDAADIEYYVSIGQFGNPDSGSLKNETTKSDVKDTIYIRVGSSQVINFSIDSDKFPEGDLGLGIVVRQKNGAPLAWKKIPIEITGLPTITQIISGSIEVEGELVNPLSGPTVTPEKPGFLFVQMDDYSYTGVYDMEITIFERQIGDETLWHETVPVAFKSGQGRVALPLGIPTGSQVGEARFTTGSNIIPFRYIIGGPSAEILSVNTDLLTLRKDDTFTLYLKYADTPLDVMNPEATEYPENLSVRIKIMNENGREVVSYNQSLNTPEKRDIPEINEDSTEEELIEFQEQLDLRFGNVYTVDVPLTAQRDAHSLSLRLEIYDAQTGEVFDVYETYFPSETGEDKKIGGTILKVILFIFLLLLALVVFLKTRHKIPTVCLTLIVASGFIAHGIVEARLFHSNSIHHANGTQATTLTFGGDIESSATGSYSPGDFISFEISYTLEACTNVPAGSDVGKVLSTIAVPHQTLWLQANNFSAAQRKNLNEFERKKMANTTVNRAFYTSISGTSDRYPDEPRTWEEVYQHILDQALQTGGGGYSSHGWMPESVEVLDEDDNVVVDEDGEPVYSVGWEKYVLFNHLQVPEEADPGFYYIPVMAASKLQGVSGIQYLGTKGNNPKQQYPMYDVYEICVKGAGVCPDENPPLTVSCNASPSSIQTGSSVTFNTSGVNQSGVTYKWHNTQSGSAISGATGSSYSRSYSNTGNSPRTETMYVTVSKNGFDSATASCPVTVEPQPEILSVSCSVNPDRVQTNQSVSFSASVNSEFSSGTTYAWRTTSAQTGSSLSTNQTYSTSFPTAGERILYVTAKNGNQTKTAMCPAVTVVQDKCTNLADIQESVPTGYTASGTTCNISLSCAVTPANTTTHPQTNQDVTFTANSSKTSNISYVWSTISNGTALGFNKTYSTSYTTTGSKTMYVRLTDPNIKLNNGSDYSITNSCSTNIKPEPVPDLCANIPGDQASVPTGHTAVLKNGIQHCVPTPISGSCTVSPAQTATQPRQGQSVTFTANQSLPAGRTAYLPNANGTFTAYSSLPDNRVNFSWSGAAGEYIPYITKSYSRTYSSPGTYTVTAHVAYKDYPTIKQDMTCSVDVKENQAPTATPSVTGITTTSGTLNWIYLDPESDPQADFVIEYTTNKSLFPSTSAPGVSGVYTPGVYRVVATSLDNKQTIRNKLLSNLTPDTLYHVRVAVKDNPGTNIPGKWSLWAETSFTTNPTSGGTCTANKSKIATGQYVTYTASPLGSQYRYQWRRSPSNSWTPVSESSSSRSLQFTSEGTFTTLLLLTNTSTGATTEISCPPVLVEEDPLTVSCTRPSNKTQIDSGESVTYTASASKSGVTYQWKLEESGSWIYSSPASSPSKTYTFNDEEQTLHYVFVRARNSSGEITEAERCPGVTEVPGGDEPPPPPVIKRCIFNPPVAEIDPGLSGQQSCKLELEAEVVSRCYVLPGTRSQVPPIDGDGNNEVDTTGDNVRVPIGTYTCKCDGVTVEGVAPVPDSVESSAISCVSNADIRED